MIKLIIFDLDGTLADTRLDIADSVNYALKRFNLDPKRVEEVTAAVGYGVDNLIRQCLSHSSENITSIKEVIRIFRDHYAEHCTDKSELYPGVKFFLQKHQKLSLSVLSNKPEEYCRLILTNLGIISYFQKVAGGDTTPHKKPHPSGIEYLLDHFKVSPADTILVGDSEPDVIVSKASGIKSIGIKNGMGNTELLIKADPDYLIDDFTELGTLLRKINSEETPNDA